MTEDKLRDHGDNRTLANVDLPVTVDRQAISCNLIETVHNELIAINYCAVCTWWGMAMSTRRMTLSWVVKDVVNVW